MLRQGRDLFLEILVLDEVGGFQDLDRATGGYDGQRFARLTVGYLSRLAGLLTLATSAAAAAAATPAAAAAAGIAFGVGTFDGHAALAGAMPADDLGELLGIDIHVVIEIPGGKLATIAHRAAR